MACRDAGRAQIACDELRRVAATDRISILPLDLSNQRSIRRAVDQFLNEHSSLDVLVNNAGAWWADRRVSPDGIELVWATNVVGPYVLTKLLLPALHASGAAESSTSRPVTQAGSILMTSSTSTVPTVALRRIRRLSRRCA